MREVPVSTPDSAESHLPGALCPSNRSVANHGENGSGPSTPSRTKAQQTEGRCAHNNPGGQQMGSNHPTPVGSNPPSERAHWTGPTAHDPLLDVVQSEALTELAARSPFRCPHCSSDAWLPGPTHYGQHAARCVHCLHVYNAEEASHGG
jgi:hypothetical protein